LVGRQLPARVLGVDAELVAVPRDVGVGIEVLGDRLPAQAAYELRVRFRAPDGALLLGHGVVGAEQGAGGGGRHDPSPLMARFARLLRASRTLRIRSGSSVTIFSRASPSMSAKTKNGATS